TDNDEDHSRRQDEPAEDRRNRDRTLLRRGRLDGPHFQNLLLRRVRDALKRQRDHSEDDQHDSNQYDRILHGRVLLPWRATRSRRRYAPGWKQRVVGPFGSPDAPWINRKLYADGYWARKPRLGDSTMY